MRKKDPEVMDAICAFVDRYYRDRHRSPYLQEIAAATGISKTTSYRYVLAMNASGMLSYDGESIRTSGTEKCATGYFSAPLVGSIRCGNPETEEEWVEEYVSLPKSIFGEGQFYILRALGDSMIDAGIEEGDLLVIRKQETAEIGDIVVALDESGENTLKAFGGIDGASGDVILCYRNEGKYPHKEIHVKQLTVQGVAKHVIKRL